MEAALLIDIGVPIALLAVMLGLGLSLQVADFTRILDAPISIFAGLGCQLVLLPLLGIGIAIGFGLDERLALGLVVLSACPGGALSNALSHWARADLALSVSLTAIASMVTPWTIPIVVRWAASRWWAETQDFTLALGPTILQLLAISVVPIVVGMAVRRRWPNRALLLERHVRRGSVVLFAAVVAGVTFQSRDALAVGLREAGAAALALNLCAMTLALAVSQSLRLSRERATTLGIELGMQNAATATFVTATLLGDPVMAIPAAVYAIVMVPSAVAFGVLRMRTRLDRDDRGVRSFNDGSRFQRHRAGDS